MGEDTAALVGATLLNLVGLAIGQQATLDPHQRRPVALLIDEFHTMPGADYEAILAELAKYGASLVLATQSLTRLEALDREQHRALRATVFANLDGLFAFHISAEDARYLVHELGPEVDEQDLVALGEHRCYVRLSAGGERLPTFSVQLDPPPVSDPAVADQLAVDSTALYGRHRAAVEADLQSALARIELSHRTLLDQSLAGQGSAGIARDATTTDGKPGQQSGQNKARNNHRPQKRPRPRPHQATLFDHAATEECASDETPALSEAEGGEASEKGKHLT